jgi:hypothetical protein
LISNYVFLTVCEKDSRKNTVEEGTYENNKVTYTYKNGREKIIYEQALVIQGFVIEHLKGKENNFTGIVRSEVLFSVRLFKTMPKLQAIKKCP